MARFPFSTLNGQEILIVTGVTTVVSALLQLVLGSPMITVALVLSASVFGLLAFWYEGPYTVGAWLALFYALGNSLVALYAKTLFGQPINSHLDTPNYSFFLILLSSFDLFSALVIIRKVKVGRPLLRRTSDPKFLSFLSWSCFGLGVIFWALNLWLNRPHGFGFGGFAIFRMLILMAVIGRTAMLLERSNDQKTFDVFLGLILVLSVFLGILDDTKTATALPVVSYYATLAFYLKSIPRKQLLSLPICALFFVLIVTPEIQALRAFGMERDNLVQRINLLYKNIGHTIIHPSNFSRLDAIAKSRFEGGYYNYFGGHDSKQMLLGRFCSVQQIDPVISRVNQFGTLGFRVIVEPLTKLVPYFLYPDKPRHTEAYDVLTYYRLINRNGGKHPTLPLAGQAYAAFGFAGVLVIPFLTFLCFLIVLKKLGNDLYRNVYAIFFLCEFVIVYSSQGSLGEYFGAAIRYFPSFAIAFLAIGQCYKYINLALEKLNAHFNNNSKNNYLVDDRY